MWFEQSVTEALTKAKNDQLLVMIFIYGDNQESMAMRDIWENDEQIRSLLQDRVIALNFADDSDDARMFKQSCPVLVIPSVYFISFDGMPLTVFGGSKSQPEVKDKVEEALRLYEQRLKQSKEQKSQMDEQQTPTDSQTTDNVSADQSGRVQCEDGVCHLVQEDQPQASSSSGSDNLEERQAKTKRLLAELKAKRESQEAENEIKREKERIQMGKALQEAKNKREDNEIDEMIKQREKEQQEAKLAREHVMAMIKADQEERKAREKAEREAVVFQTQNKICQRKSKSVVANKATIQFRMPDGSQFVHAFEKNQPLSDAYKQVTASTSLRTFQLYQTFPKRKFESEDSDKTFEELLLVPSSTLLVMQEPDQLQNVTQTGTNLVYTIFDSFYALLLVLLNFFKGLLFPSSNNTLPPQAASSVHSSDQDHADKSKATNVSNQSKLLRESNIKRLSDLNDDDDDENNTYNGNSTQQM